MSNSELALFKKDTDAIATNRGFLYQYLKTLNTWIKNFIEGNKVEIYCETEDDIKELDLINSIVRFSQVKCYSTSFSLKSEDIQKSIFNFFILYAEYNCKYSGEFQFITNSMISKRSTLLKKWAKSNGDLNKDLLDELIDEVKSIVKDFINKEKDAQIKKYDDMVSTRVSKMSSDPSKDSKIQQSIDQIQSKKSHLINQYGKAIEYVENDRVLKDFVAKIKWVFEEKSAEESIEILKAENIELISKIKQIEGAPKTMEARLLTEVFHKSSQSLVEHRVLTHDLFLKIIKESEEEMLKKADMILVSIYFRFDTLEGKLDTLIAELVDKEKERFTNKNNEIQKIDLHFFEDEEIEQLLIEKEEEKKNQSNLEKKISNIGLDGDTDFLISIATTNRCSYLLYLEELRLSGRTIEYKLIKSLEQKVRRLCFNQVRKNQKDENFNSHKFWLGFQDVLTEESRLFEKDKDIEIDDEIVFAQMYQIAAECPLRWHKE
ncbi:dsDNA nuclease domain-containing protein [Peribacillus frigoritolerans]|uniref:dsDNA nuclease domain-containing protein n=1 Tax=Peribacillus frigoritolerans TaxID=450367 RepID=UPI002079C581|nr:dsDNA nuclease domain-containing protein [Peribacillus frigoritolerans]USK65875.1 DUF4297 domain-containing protein [Peribacillus frigoritolerans]